MDYDLKNEDDVKEFLDKLGTEYRFSCFSEKKPESCQLLGEYLETIKSDFDKAMKVYRNNCDEYNHPKSCFRYGFLALKGKGPKQSREEALSYFDKGCTHGEPEACTTGGIMTMTDALKTDPDKPIASDDKGLSMVKRGCDLKNSYACYHLSALYITGRNNISKDMEQAFKYATMGCDLGCIYSCGNLSQMYKRGDGTTKDDIKADFFKAKTLDMMDQYKEQVQFQRDASN